MWEYKIYQTDLGWSIYKKKEKGNLISLYFLGSDSKRVLNKSSAKVFYTVRDVESALVIMRNKDNSEEG